MESKLFVHFRAVRFCQNRKNEDMETNIFLISKLLSSVSRKGSLESGGKRKF